MINNTHIRIFSLAFIVFCQTACSTSNVSKEDFLYFRKGGSAVTTQKETTIKKHDLLSIQVFSNTINQEQAAVFNMSVVKESALSATGAGAGETQGSAGQGQGYEVGADGNIEMPVIGSIKAEGLTKQQLKEALKGRLKEYIKLPNVNIRFLKFNVNVIGEVKLPGNKTFQSDRVTIIDALSAAGDLTDYGKRESVTVIREENNTKAYYKIDLRNKNLFESPAYVLQQNDIVYVEPNANKLKNLTVNPEAQRRTSTILTITGLALSLGTLVVTLLLNN
jgi:polysaccharide export outer membrane protein